MKPRELETYINAALQELKSQETGREVVWNGIAKKAGIPEDLWPDVRDVLYDRGYLFKTKEVKGMGHFVRAQPSVTTFLLSQEHNALPTRKARRLAKLISEHPIFATTVSTGLGAVLGALIIYLIFGRPTCP